MIKKSIKEAGFSIVSIILMVLLLCYDAYTGKFFVGTFNQIFTILFFICIIFDSLHVQQVFRRNKLSK